MHDRRESTRSAVMKRTLASLSCAVAITLLLGAWSNAPDGASPKLELYRAHAGDAVENFSYHGRLDSWEALDDSTIAVWTRPSKAWLIDLVGICGNLKDTPVIGITSQGKRVHGGHGEVLVRDASGHQSPCYIKSIRPLDMDAIRQAKLQSSEVKAPAA
jgi:hypothetical protein